MLDNETLRGVLAMGFFVGGGGLFLLFFQPAGSAEFVLSACSAGMGGAIIAVVLLARRFDRRS
jgi:hypothetical protein